MQNCKSYLERFSQYSCLPNGSCLGKNVNTVLSECKQIQEDKVDMCHNIVSVYYTCGVNATSDIHWWSSSQLWPNCSFLQSSTTSCFPVCMCVLISQDQAFGELEKNSDKILQGTSSSDSSQPAHLHELLCSLQKQLLAYCHINCVTEVLVQLNVYN